MRGRLRLWLDTRILAGWAEWGNGVPLVVLTSPFRSLVRPLLDYIDGLLAQQEPGGLVAVVLPEFVPSAGGTICSTIGRRSSSKAPCCSGVTLSWLMCPTICRAEVRPHS